MSDKYGDAFWQSLLEADDRAQQIGELRASIENQAREARRAREEEAALERYLFRDPARFVPARIDRDRNPKRKTPKHARKRY